MPNRSVSKRKHLYWPPSTNDSKGWDSTLRERPDLAPAIEKAEPQVCRVVDGEADWLECTNTFRPERLSALGNGVVPLTGAVAIQELFRRYLQTRGAI